MGVATGTFQYPNGSPVASGLYQWKLSSDAIEFSGTSACIVPPVVRGNLDSSGNLTTTFAFNDVLSTTAGAVTTYQLTVKDIGGGQVWNENYYLTGTAANLNLIAPGGSAPPFVTVTATVSVVTVTGGAVYTATGGPGFFGPGIPQGTSFLGDTQTGINAATAFAANSILAYQFGLDATYAVRHVGIFLALPPTVAASALIGFSIWDPPGVTKFVDSGPMTATATNTFVTVSISAVTLTPGAYLLAVTQNVDGRNINPFGMQITTNLPQQHYLTAGNANTTRYGIAASVSSAGVFPAALGAITAFTPNTNAYLVLPFFEP